MRISLFCHSLLSDWNHGNAHFLRGVVTELVERGHRVKVYEAADAWSPTQLTEQYGETALLDAQRQYPALDIQRYAPSDLDLESAIGNSELAIVHEWTPHDLVSRIGATGKRLGCRLLFHDTHHRAVTAPEEMRRYDLSAFDGVLAFGEVLREIYLSRRWAERVWTWHEAADARVFKPLPEISPERDLVWVGNWGDDERVRELQEFLIDPIARLNSSARVHGVRYPESALASLARAKIEYAGWLPNYRVPEAFARARVTVHVPRNAYVIALPGIPTIRPFEALACGIPLICSPWQDAEGLFRAGKDYLLARDGREMTEMLRLLLNEPEAARELAVHGRNTVLARHTCAHRVDELLSICRELGLNTQVASGALEPESTRAPVRAPVEVAQANLRVVPDLGIQVRPAECAVGLRLVLPSDPRRQARISRVLAEFPAIRVEFSPFDAPVDPALTLEVFEWARRDCDLAECDRIAAHAADSSTWLYLRGADLPEDVLFQVLTRYQRLLTRTDVACCDPLFARVLERHRALHDLSKPLVRADFDHAIDVWLWLLRIEPGASRALQWAALFHDIERLESEADFRIEQHAPDYQAFKDAHAEQGARMTRAVLTAAGVTEEEADQVAQWIVWHERPAHEDRSYDSSALADADALSFFSLNSPGFMNYYGLEHTQKKIAYSLSRMSPRAKKLLTRIKLRADVQDALLRVFPGGAAAKAAELAGNFESGFETEPTLNQ